MRRRTLLWSAAGLSLTGLLVVGLVCQGPARTRVGPDWIPSRLFWELREAGEDWEARPSRGGLLLRRPGHPASWEELAALCEGPPERFAASPGRLYVLFDGGVRAADDSPADLHLPPLIVRGHPHELRRVVDLLAP